MVMENIVLNNVNTNLSAASSPNFQKRRRNRKPVDRTPQEKLDRIYRSQGLIGKLFDKIQGAFGAQYSKKNLQKAIKSGDKNIDRKLDRYYDRQKNETEMAIDLATGLSSVGIFKLGKKLISYSHMYAKNPKFELYAGLIGAGISAVIGMCTKPFYKSLNRIGMSKQDRKNEKTTWRDIGTGFIDGAAAPLAFAYKWGLAGAVGINSLSRYLFNKKADKNSDLGEHLSSSWLVKVPLLGAAVFSAFKFHKGIDKIEKAIVKSKANIKDIQIHDSKLPLTELLDLGKSNLSDEVTQKGLMNAAHKGFFSKTYRVLTWPLSKLRNNKKAAMLEFVPKPAFRITMMSKDLIKEKEMMNIMREIEQYNIFYPKMLQSMPSNIAGILEMGAGKDLNKIIEDFAKRFPEGFAQKRVEYVGEKGINAVNTFLNNYKSKCPASRTAKEAQKYISGTFGKKYTIVGKEPIGVGTIAETFLARDNEANKDVVIKMVKKWATPEKLNGDKAKMLQALERVKDKLSADDYNYQRKLVDDLYQAWSKELDMKLEADAAKTLGKYAVHYNTVAPIEVKNNIFVMEKANGVQFDKFVDYLKENNIQLTKDEVADLTRKYFQVFFEQLLSVPKKGQKVFHADPHAGNIFIDLKNKEKPFTFIDTGNVMRFTPEEAIQNVTSHVDYLIGNSQNIAKRLLKGAKLPDNMTEKEAVDMLKKHLDEVFFSGKYKIRKSDPFSAINNEAMEFMRKNKVILNSSNTNFVKAELTYLINMTSLAGLEKHIKLDSVINEEEQQKQMKLMGKQILEAIRNGVINNKECTLNEVMSRLKYINDNPEQFITSLYTYVPPKV